MDTLLALIDEALDTTSHREQFTAREVADLLLDLRNAIPTSPELVAVPA